MPALLHLQQGIKWIKSRAAADGLVIVQQSQPKYIDKVIACIESGTPLMFENLPIDIDAGVCAHLATCRVHVLVFHGSHAYELTCFVKS